MPLYIEALERFDWPLFWSVGTDRFYRGDHKWIEATVNGTIWRQVVGGTYHPIYQAIKSSPLVSSQ